MPSDLLERRRCYMKKAQEKAKETNKLRGMLSFVSKTSKKSTYKNQLIDKLLDNGIYNNIWSKYNQYLDETEKDNDKILEYLNEKEIEIILLFDNIEPNLLETKKDGYYIQETPLDL